MTETPAGAPTTGRCLLFTPATRPDRFAKAAASGADGLIVDLEDAVAPADKNTAREAALVYLAQAPVDGPARILRINAIDTRAGLADISAVLDARGAPDFLLLPKTESPDLLGTMDTLLTAAGKNTRLIALIESARGLAAVEVIAVATPRLYALMFGAADMAADLGAATAWQPLLAARSRVVAAAALRRLAVIDSPFFDIHDAGGLARETADAVALGFTAKAAIHPAQVATINAALTPSGEEIERARAILAENAKGVGAVDGRMIDEAVARKARRVLAAAGAASSGREP